MTNFDFVDILLDFFSKITPETVVKFFLLTLVFFYLFFAFALLRQVQLMAKVVEVKASPLLNILGILHLLSALGLFIFGILLL